MKNKLKILYFYSDYYHYPLFRQFRDALSKVADVTFFDLGKTKVIRRDAFELTKKFKPDVIVIGKHNHNYRLVDNLDKINGVIKVIICGDPHVMFKHHIKFINKKKIDLVLVGAGVVEKYKQELYKGCIVKSLPFSINTEVFKDYELERKWDVYLSGIVIGHKVYPFRQLLYDVLTKQPDIKTNIKHGFVNVNQYAKEISQSKILIFDGGIHNYLCGRAPQGMSSKTLVMSPKPLGMEEYHLIPDYNFVEINEDNFLEKVRYYLEHKEERERIVNNAYETILKYHTCEIRIKEFIRMINEIRGIRLELTKEE